MADRRADHTGLRLVGAHDEAIQTGLVHDGKSVGTACVELQAHPMGFFVRELPLLVSSGQTNRGSTSLDLPTVGQRENFSHSSDLWVPRVTMPDLNELGVSSSSASLRRPLSSAGRDLLLALDVHAVLADRREYHAGHPVLEGAGLRLVRAHDELVEAGLGDKLVRRTLTAD